MAINLLPRSGIFIAAFLVITFLVWIHPVDSRAAEIQVIPSDVIPDISDPQKLELVSGKSVVLKSSRTFERVSLGDPEVATAQVLTPRNQVYLLPKKAGTTNLILWHNKDTIAEIYELSVVYQLSQLKQRIHEVFPDETELRVISTHDSITLSGRVSSTSNLDQIMTLAEAFAPKDKIRNMVQVGGVHQVMLEVKVADVSKDSMDKLGVNFNLINMAERFAIDFPGRILQPPSPPGTLSIWRDSGNVQWEAIFDFLKEQGTAKILAEPSLIALSGQTASFLAGGEFPIPSLDREGQTGSVTFKSYGIELSFTPTVLNKDRIAIKVVPVVSELDFGTAANIFGANVPGLRVRRADTTVELGDGQTFAIAGLLSENSREAIRKFPGLGDLPILGAFFTNKSFQSRENELVILVTPRLVKPIVDIEQPLPTDFYIEPDDTEFYLYGLFGPAVDRVHRQEQANFDGEFGHVIVR